MAKLPSVASKLQTSYNFDVDILKFSKHVEQHMKFKDMTAEMALLQNHLMSPNQCIEGIEVVIDLENGAVDETFNDLENDEIEPI